MIHKKYKTSISCVLTGVIDNLNNLKVIYFIEGWVSTWKTLSYMIIKVSNFCYVRDFIFQDNSVRGSPNHQYLCPSLDQQGSQGPFSSCQLLHQCHVFIQASTCKWLINCLNALQVLDQICLQCSWVMYRVSWLKTMFLLLWVM